MANQMHIRKRNIPWSSFRNRTEFAKFRDDFYLDLMKMSTTELYWLRILIVDELRYRDECMGLAPDEGKRVIIE